MRLRDFINMVVEGENSSPSADANFRRWFGSSKVVDGNNSPLIVFHGSNAHAYIDGEIRSFHTNGERRAAFFTSNRQLATEYGERLYGVFLRIENPLVVYGNGKFWNSLDGSEKIGGNVTDQLRKHHKKQAEELSSLFSDPDLFPEGPTEARSKIADHEMTLDRHNLDLITAGNSQSTDNVVKYARTFGYDGVIFHNIKDSPTSDQGYRHHESDIYAVFSSRQVKSASINSGEYSHDDSDIFG